MVMHPRSSVHLTPKEDTIDTPNEDVYPQKHLNFGFRIWHCRVLHFECTVLGPVAEFSCLTDAKERVHHMEASFPNKVGWLPSATYTAQFPVHFAVPQHLNIIGFSHIVFISPQVTESFSPLHLIVVVIPLSNNSFTILCSLFIYVILPI